MAEMNGSQKDAAIKMEADESVIKHEVKEETGDDESERKTGDSGVQEKEKPVLLDLDPETRAKKIKRQIEYYFGDYNLPTDKFLREEVKRKEGWVALETLLKFRRLAVLTQDPLVIVDALQGSELIQISEDKTEVRRNPDKPLPVECEARRKEIMTRTVYVKGFPQDGFTIDSALDFFETYGPTDDIVMRYFQDKAEKSWKFKGSVFVKYPTKEAAAAFLALEEVKHGDTPLIKMWQEEYVEEKRKERLEQRMQKRKRPLEENQQDKKPENEERGLPLDATLHMTKCPDTLVRETVKEKIEDMGFVVAFIDFNKGDSEGWIRLHETGTAAKVMEKCEGGVLKLKDDVEVELRRLEGEEEATFLENAKKSINARRFDNKGRQQKGRRGGRGGRRGGRGNWGRNRHDTDEPANKRVKLEEGSGGDDD